MEKKFLKKSGGILPGSTVNSVLPGKSDQLSQDAPETVDNDVSDNENNSGSSVGVKDVASGLWKLSSFKTKLIIIGVGVALIFFLILLITPLMHLGIIDIKGSGGSSSIGYINSSYAYCDSINVDGNLVPLEEYVAGVIQHEVGMFIKDSAAEEGLKALSVAARTYAIYYTNGCKKSIPNGSTAQGFLNPNDNARQIANSTAGLVLAYNGDLFLSEYDSFCTSCSDFTSNSDGTYTVTYKKLPTGDEHIITFSDMTYANHIIDGNPHGHGRGMSQYVAVQYSRAGMDYKDILKDFYSDGVEVVSLQKFKVGYTSNVQGTDYIGTYTNVKSGKTYKNFKQRLYDRNLLPSDWSDSKKEHLANVGCGTNAAAIVLSGEDDSITPISLYIENGYTVGPHLSRYPYSIDSFNYCNTWNSGYCTNTRNDTKLLNSDMSNKLISNLNNGGTAILFINYSADKCTINGVNWTNSQHFFSVLDYNPTDNTIYVSNPAYDNTQSGWFSLDDFDCVHVAYLLYPQ